MGQILLHFLIGGVVVSAFAMLGDVFRPKSFAGLFSAAPSIALGTISLTIVHSGRDFAAVEARSMVLGAVAFALYATLVSRLLARFPLSTLLTSVALLSVWFAASYALWYTVLRAA